mmetsp:Transcript_22136/g.41520  ORF Transcript_22136/g.41520 Transcript_22136/m.41520 type:complete len:322 (-) Transcript_22136:29-994(-)
MVQAAGGTAGSSNAQDLQALHLRERALARADEVLTNKVEQSVNAKLRELEIKPARITRAGKEFSKITSMYPAIIGKAVSKKERDDEDLHDDQGLVYGEIQFATFALALEKIRHKYKGLREPGGVFVDVGSGTGKPVFAALLMHEFDKVIGIEILNGLHDISLELQAVWNETKASADVTSRTRNTEIELIRGDAFKVDWHDADIAFVNSTCFDAEMMDRLADKADRMKPGSFFISFTRRIPSDEWQVLEYERHLMSWGEATVFIQQRKNDEEEISGSETGSEVLDTDEDQGDYEDGEYDDEDQDDLGQESDNDEEADTTPAP